MRARKSILSSRPSRQRGAVMLILLAAAAAGVAAVPFAARSGTMWRLDRNRKTADTLEQAREALIGDAAMQSPVSDAGYLRLPDLGFGIGQPAEGSAAPNFSGNNKDYGVIGKLPWKTLKLGELRDGQGECLWYAVSGRFKNNPATDALNWDTQGQIDVIDGNGNPIASNLAAVIIAPGQALDGQQRTQANPVYAQCGGNYDARNYLDAYDEHDALANEVNYFEGSSNHRVANSSDHKRFVMAESAHYNDRFLFVSADDIYRHIIRRTDFAAQVSAMMNDAYFRSVAITGAKGTGSIVCGNLATPANQAFCRNWQEMLLLTQLSMPSSITIDGVLTPPCARVLLFGGQKAANQARLLAFDKANPANYLEDENKTYFAAPVAYGSGFRGASTFDYRHPSTDLLRCL